MQMTKRRNSLIIVILVFTLIAIYGFVPLVQAASLTNVRDLLSSSTNSATNVTHAVGFTTTQAITQNQYMEVIIPTGFAGVVVGNVSCPDAASTTASVEGAGPFTVKCTVNNGETVEAGVKTLTITGTTNPAASGSYTINVATKTNVGADIEKSSAKVYILNAVTMNATVDASLTFAVSGLDAGDTVNGAAITATSTATTTPFGTLGVNATSSVGQRLAVSTNASNGYVVTVSQSQPLTSNAGGSTINSFRDSPAGTGSTTAAVWAAPANSLGNPDTYGHLGLTSSDISLSTGNDFGGAKYKGFAGTAGTEIMYHDDPADALTDNIGVAKVAYTVEIAGLQEAGDYTSTLTYVCTPTF